MEGSGLEFDCCIVNLENSNKIHQELQYRERFYCCFSHPFLSDVIPSISGYTRCLVRLPGEKLSGNTCSDEFFFPLIVIGGDHSALP
jgi:hypothetical protein